MISIAGALEIAAKGYPKGPESLASHLGIAVLSCPLSGCDGWCIRSNDSAKIRINSKNAKSRQRFTLAHELTHLVMGHQSEVFSAEFAPSFGTVDATERIADQFAAEMLLPEGRLQALVRSVPVDAAALRRVARDANVSELMVACRVATLAPKLGLQNAAVVVFVGGTQKWTWSPTFGVSESEAARLFKKVQAAGEADLVRCKNQDGRVVVASILANPYGDCLFFQLLPAELGERQTVAEQRKALEAFLFGNDSTFRNQMSGCFGAFKPDACSMQLEDALAEFEQRYGSRWDGSRFQRLHSAQGRKYLRLRLAEWCEE